MKTALAVMAAGILCALVAVTRRKARLRGAFLKAGSGKNNRGRRAAARIACRTRRSNPAAKAGREHFLLFLLPGGGLFRSKEGEDARK